MSNPPNKSWQGSDPPPLLGNARIFTAFVVTAPTLLNIGQVAKKHCFEKHNLTLIPVKMSVK